MNRIISLLFFIICFVSVRAEQTTVDFEFLHLPSTSNRLTVYNILGEFSNTIPESALLEPDQNGKCTYTLDIKSSQFLKLGFVIDESNSNYIPYVLFLTPGDHIKLKADFAKKDGAIVVTGKGSSNNQPAIQSLMLLDLSQRKNDTLPGKVLNMLRLQQQKNKKLLAGYITKYHPSKQFIAENYFNQQYFTPSLYYIYKEDFKFVKQSAYKRNFNQWDNVQRHLFKTVKLCNDDALYSYNYINFITRFVPREMERSLLQYNEDSKAFYGQWYPGEDPKQIKFLKEFDNLFVVKVIYRYFSGCSAEFLYSQLLKGNLRRGTTRNLDILYKDFVKRYPNNVHLTYLKAPVAELIKRGN